MAHNQGEFNWAQSGFWAQGPRVAPKTRPCKHSDEFVESVIVAKPGEYMMDATGHKKISLKAKAQVKIGKKMIQAKIMSFDVVKREVTVKVDDPEFTKFITVPAHNVYMFKKEYERLYSSED
tara:strand:- start:263 stop:628 length:366 start_codon:yes stop_codon:yes gene_type:complete